MVRRSSDDLKAEFRDTLANIKTMCTAFDTGAHSIVKPLSSEIIKIFEEGDGPSLAANLQFPSPQINVNSANMSDDTFLICYQIGPNGGTHIPLCKTGNWIEEWNSLDKWWNDDPVVIQVPTDIVTTPSGKQFHVAKTVPFEEKNIFTRKKLVRLARNKLGSHIDKKIPGSLDTMLGPTAMGFGMASNMGGNIGEEEWVVPEVTGLAAMIRQIAEEVILADDINSV